VSSDPTDLARLHDIVMPAPLPLWPPAPGWLWLLGFAAVAGLVLLLRALIRFQRNRYRREALAELKRLRGLDAQHRPELLAGLSILLKRTALSAYPRREVAELTGPDWFRLLDRCANTRFSEGLGAALENSNFTGSTTAWETSQLERLGEEVQRWIRQHRAAVAAGRGDEAAAP
jgi:hypothetical protein